MKKRDLLLTGAMLFGMSLSTQAQEQLFFFGFEDGTASFTDSANALDSITQLQYYSHKGSNSAGLKPEEFELGPTYDTTMLKRYIKASTLDIANKIITKYDYFN